MNRARQLLLLVLMLLVSLQLVSGTGKTSSKPSATASEQTLEVALTPEAPVIDGIADDECWHRENVKELLFFTGRVQVINVKICRDRDYLYLLIKYPAETENHRATPCIGCAGVNALHIGLPFIL